MSRELFRILNTIKEKTGIAVAVLSRDKSIDLSTFSEYFLINDKYFNKKEEVFVDKDAGKTSFKFTFNGVEFIALIDNEDGASKKYAFFIKDYIENSQVKSVELSFTEEYLSIITGDTTKSKTAHFISKYSISKNNCLCMVIKTVKNKSNEVCEFLKDYSISNSDNAVVIDDNTAVFVKFIDNDIKDEYLSESEYARGIIRSLYEELGIVANAFLGGKVNSFQDINLSYSQALVAERMNLAFGVKSDICSYKDFIIVKMLEDISKNKLEEYMSAILDPNAKEIITDEELLITGEEFLKNDLNVSETARILHVHRNTLIYRLNKIQKISGLDLRKFNDALDFKIISVLSRLIG